MSKLNLNQKIRLIARKAGAIHKQQDGFSHIEDILDAVNGLIDRQGLIFTGSLVDFVVGLHPMPKGCIRDVFFRWALEDCRTKEARTWDIPGSGFDTDFDGSGIAKALTASRKAALILAFNLRVLEFSEEKAAEERKAEWDRKQLQADLKGQEKIDAANAKRKKTNEAKEKVVIEWPESHKGNYAWVRGRIHIFEKQAVEVMNVYATNFNDREDAWLVAEHNVRDLIADLELKGCTVDLCRNPYSSLISTKS